MGGRLDMTEWTGEWPRPVVLAASLIPSGMLFLAVFGGWDYSFFILLRWLVSSCAAYLAVIARQQRSSGWMWTMGAIMVLFNPLVPIHLRRGTWVYLDLLVAMILGYSPLWVRAVPGSQHSGGGS